MYQSLSLPPAPDNDTIALRGLRLFLFVLEHGSPAAALLDRDGCELAQYAARMASDNRGASAQYYDRVAETERHLTARARTIARAAELARPAVVDVPAAPVVDDPTPDSHRPNDGPMAPLSPRPRVTPPAATAVIDW